MASRRNSFHRHLDERGPGVWPCPCCGHRTLHDGPGAYDVCPVCWWEDDGAQLRWPTLADGPNGTLSLLDAQRHFARYGACAEGARDEVRDPWPGEEPEAGWRPIDLEIDDVESGPDDPTNLPWPALDELYWWRPTYFRLPENRGPAVAPRRPPADAAETMMARIIDAVPETEVVDVRVRSRWAEPAPFLFCSELGPFVLDALRRGDGDLARRVVVELEEGLRSSDEFAASCVSNGFLASGGSVDGDLGFGRPELAPSTSTWPRAIRRELREQTRHRLRVQRRDARRARVWRQQPDGSVTIPLRWKLRHPILWQRARRDSTSFWAG